MISGIARARGGILDLNDALYGGHVRKTYERRAHGYQSPARGGGLAMARTLEVLFRAWCFVPRVREFTHREGRSGACKHAPYASKKR